MLLRTRLLPVLILLVIAGAVALSVVLSAPPVTAQPPVPPTPTSTVTPASRSTPSPRSTPLPAALQPRLVRVEFVNQAAINRLAAGYDVWEVHHAADGAEGGWALVMVDAPDEARLRLEGYVIRAAPPQAADALGRFCGVQNIDEFPCYRTLEETFVDLALLASANPTLATWVDIGDSWEKQTRGADAGNDLQVLVITNHQRTTPKFRFFLMGALHARELATAETASRFAELLITGYGVDPAITWLLDHGEAHILAQANPDGRARAEMGLCWRKNTNTTISCLEDRNLSGVDLNRNFAFRWNECAFDGCSTNAVCSQTYRGVAPASEPEVVAIQSYLASIFPDVRGELLSDAAPLETSGALISLHSFGELVMYPWGWTNEPSPNAPQLQLFADKMGFYTGYRACAAGANGCLYNTDGTTDDWLYGERGIPGFTIEMGNNFFQSCEYYETEMADDLLASLLYAFKAARRPYLTPAGPEPVNVTLSTDVVRQGEPLTLTATLDTTRLHDNGGRVPGNEITPTVILSATWYLNSPSWVAGSVGLPMQASDGALDDAVEEVHALIDTATLPTGCHMLLVEGTDENGQNGVPGAVGFEVLPRVPVAPTPQPHMSTGGCWQKVMRYVPLIIAAEE